MSIGIAKSSIALALTLATGLAILGLPDPALAADAGATSAVSNLISGDGPLTIHGITLYGTIDAGFASLNHGTNSSDYYTNTQPYAIQKWSSGNFNGLVQSPLEQSKLGVKGTEDLGEGFAAVFKFETGFNPLNGNLMDGLKSLTIDSYVSTASPNFVQQGDSSRAGQFLQGAAYGGVSHQNYGTLTYGRQTGLLYDTIQAADPMGGAYAFGLLGNSSTLGGSGGDTQDARLDNSIRYANTIGPVRLGAQYQWATPTDGGEGYQFGLGLDYKGFSLDGVYLDKTGGTSASSLSTSDKLVLGTAAATAACPGCGLNNTLDATLSDNKAWAIAARYDGGNFKLFAGYENISQSNSSDPEGIASASAGQVFQDIGGYSILNVTNNKYDSNKVTQVEWVGGKLLFTPKLSGSLAYYHVDQSSYLTGAKSTACTTSGQGPSTIQSNCAGSEQAVSVLLDYQWTKRLDVYGGALYSQVDGGLSSGFLNTDAAAATFGARVKF